MVCWGFLGRLGLYVGSGLVRFLLLFVGTVGLNERGVGWKFLGGRGFTDFGGAVLCFLIWF